MRLPNISRRAILVWRRNFLVWRKLMVPSILMNFGEPFLYLLGMGYGLGQYIGEMQGLPYLTFLASGLVASSAMNTASFEGLYSVYTRMVPQRTHDSMLSAPLDVDDIIVGEQLWSASKAVISGTSILLVAAILGAVDEWRAVLVIPVIFLIGFAFAGMAVAVTSISTSYDFFSYYFTLGITPMYFLCGVFFPLDNLPSVLQLISQVLPLTHGIALARPLVAGLPIDNIGLHVLVLSAYGYIGMVIAINFTRKRLIS